MGAFDQAARYATVAEPGFLHGRLRPLIGLTLSWRRWFNPRSVPLPGGPEREADLASVADDAADANKPWLLIFEFQSMHDPAKANVLLLETMIFLCHAKDTERDGAPFLPLPVFVYLQGECPQRDVTLLTPTGCGVVGKPVIWEVGKDSAANALAQVEAGTLPWGAMFWIALMRGAEEASVVELWRRLREEKVPPKSRADVTQIALVFAELAGCRREWNRVLEGVDVMTESPYLNELMEARDVRMAREFLIRMARGRFAAAITPDVERAINDQPSLTLLREWMDAASTSKDAAEFLAVLRR